jgi:hypothetical protein
VGVAIWAVGVLTLFVSLWRAWRQADQVSQLVSRLYLASLLILVAFMLSMTAENPIVDIFATAPVGLAAGCALGLQRAFARSRRFSKGHPCRPDPNLLMRWARG